MLRPTARLAEQAKQSIKAIERAEFLDVGTVLSAFCEERKTYVSAQHLDVRSRFEKENSSKPRRPFDRRVHNPQR